MSKTVTRLRDEGADVTEDEVAAIVNRIENSGGLYDKQALLRVCTESLQLCAERDQTGMVCSLRLNQENLMDVLKNLAEEMENLKSKVEVSSTVPDRNLQQLAESVQSLRKELVDKVDYLTGQVQGLAHTPVQAEKEKEHANELKPAQAEKETAEKQLEAAKAEAPLPVLLGQAGHAPFKDLSEQQPTEVLVQLMMQVCLATTPKQQPKIGNASTPSCRSRRFEISCS